MVTPRTLRPLLGIAFAGTVCLLLVVLYLRVSPSFTTGTYVFLGQEPQSFTMPFSLREATSGRFSVDVDMVLEGIYPTRYHLLPDDCLDEVWVNGQQVKDPAIPFCDYLAGRTVDLSPYLRKGSNHLTLLLYNGGGPAGLQVRVAPRDPILLALLLALLLWCSLFVLAWVRGARVRYAVYLLFFLGVVLRVWYTVSTPPWIRGHDFDGHVEYIRYVAQHFAIPPPHAGWELYHPPLYYFGAALWVRLGEFFGRSPVLLVQDLQVLSLLLSIIVLAIGIGIARALFSREDERQHLLLSTGVLATFPALIFFAARINNDVLYHLLAFVVFALLLRWWGSGRGRDWYLLCFTVGLGLLTKNNALLFVPIVLLCLLLRRGISWRRKAGHAALSLLLLAAMTGWFVVPRMLMEPDPAAFVIGNARFINQGVRVPNSLDAFVTFNPLQVLLHPYNQSWDDSARRKFFWEFLFRSAFFGEFNFGGKLRPLGIFLLLLGMVGLPLMALGCWRDLRRRAMHTIPIWVTLAILIVGHLAARWKFPYGPTQDFRYSILLVVPLTYYAIRGVEALPLRLRRAAICTLVYFIAFSAGMVFRLTVG